MTITFHLGFDPLSNKKIFGYQFCHPTIFSISLLTNSRNCYEEYSINVRQ